MDKFSICSKFLNCMKGYVEKLIVKKASRYVKNVQINSLQIDETDQVCTYKVHLDCDIYLTETQISQILHIL